MRYEMNAHAFDMLDQVRAGAIVWDSTIPIGEPGREVVNVSAQYAGTGEDDPRIWLRDALIALAEQL